MINRVDVYRYSIPMHPFTIATGTMDHAQNILVKVHCDDGITGFGECSAFPMITGESQATCFEMGCVFANAWIGSDEKEIVNRMGVLDTIAAFNFTIKSAFDMALYDIAAKQKNLPLYRFLGGHKRVMETDLTIGIDTPENMANKASDFIKMGVRIIKVKLGKDATSDIERVQRIREAAGDKVILRVDANQGWSFDEAVRCLQAIEPYQIEFCEQPMRYWNDELLPVLRSQTTIPLMADESVFDHHDARKLVSMNACDYINIKFAKSGGILEATKIVDTCSKVNMPMMMGGMLESRLALTAFAHFALAHETIRFYDMDTCMLGHKVDPVLGGVMFKGFYLDVPDSTGIGASVNEDFLRACPVFTAVFQ